ncbi:MAG: hypothetical protein ACYDCL_02920 [Myxococcales bacterium]
MSASEPLLKNVSPVKQPAKRLVVYTIIDKPGTDRSFWWRIGTAWINRDQSINIQLDAFPVNGKLHVREATDRPADGKTEQP